MIRNGHGLPVLDAARSVAPARRAEHDRPATFLLPQSCASAGCIRPGRILWMQSWWCLGCVSAVLVRTTRGAA